MLSKASRATVCGFDKAPQHVAFTLYRTLASALAKDFAMTEFAYMLLRLFGEGEVHEWSKRKNNGWINLSCNDRFSSSM